MEERDRERDERGLEEEADPQDEAAEHANEEELIGETGEGSAELVFERLPADGRKLPPHLHMFEGESPGEVLRKITVGDPLGIESLATTRIYEHAVLIDPERLAYRSFARLAYDAVISEDIGEPTLSEWIDVRIAKAIQELIEEDVSEVREALPPSPDDDYAQTIARAFEIEPELTKAACTHFNQLSHKTRRVFFMSVLEKQPLIDCVVQGLGTMDEVKERLDKALRVLMAPELYPEEEGYWEH